MDDPVAIDRLVRVVYQAGFEEGARAMYAHYTRFLNEHELCAVAFDSHLLVLKPFLYSRGMHRPEDGAMAREQSP